MEDITACREQLETLCCQVREQIEGLGVLQKTFAHEAQSLHRQDQVRRLEVLRVRVTQEIAHARQMESAASSGFTQGTLISGVMGFAIGSLIGAAFHTREHPLSLGAKLCTDEFRREEPFGKVMVAVGAAGIPDDVRVISVSGYARKQERPESEIVASIEKQGYRLMTLESFLGALDQLKGKVLNGSLNLPFAGPLSTLC
ncbi:MAG: hypothetical protein PHV74_02395 [Dehalococcoidia bacterium]|nr:hypothetical protein [Dehalococcoidia bacterium]